MTQMDRLSRAEDATRSHETGTSSDARLVTRFAMMATPQSSRSRAGVEFMSLTIDRNLGDVSLILAWAILREIADLGTWFWRKTGSTV
jgi:hypothetical protein